MLILEAIAKVRRLFRVEHKSVPENSREICLSRKVERILNRPGLKFGDYALHKLEIT